MLTVLLESRATRQRRVGGTVLSMLAHATVLTAVVALTVPDRSSARPGPDLVHRVQLPAPPTPATGPATPHPSAPAQRALPGTKVPTIDVPTITPTSIPPVDVSIPFPTSDDIVIGRRSTLPGTGAGEPGDAVNGSTSVSDVSAVDRAPRIIGRAMEPRYPPALRAAGIQGHVLAEFVVDTLGHAELTTLRFPELANPLFGDAVRDALARYRFTPGEVSRRKVRTRVAVPFDFRLEP